MKNKLKFSIHSGKMEGIQLYIEMSYLARGKIFVMHVIRNVF